MVNRDRDMDLFDSWLRNLCCRFQQSWPYSILDRFDMWGKMSRKLLWFSLSCLFLVSWREFLWDCFLRLYRHWLRSFLLNRGKSIFCAIFSTNRRRRGRELRRLIFVLLQALPELHGRSSYSLELKGHNCLRWVLDPMWEWNLLVKMGLWVERRWRLR